MSYRYSKLLLPTVLVTIFSGCGAPLATIPGRQVETQKITLGSVQGKIKEGTSSAEVVEALGSPNILTSNPDKTETWVYDKTFSESEVATGWNSAVSTKASKTFIVTIRFDSNNKVKNVSYRQTSY